MIGINELKGIAVRILMPVVVLLASQAALAQTPAPAWDFAPLFRYNFENVLVNTTTAGTWNVKVIFSVASPPLARFGTSRPRCLFRRPGPP